MWIVCTPTRVITRLNGLFQRAVGRDTIPLFG
jgi:hypothetical protein